MKKILSQKGHTIIELMAGLLITGILTAAGFEFYVSMHNQTLAQEDISEMQQNARVSIAEITKTLRMAGYKTGAHPAYEINGDSLYVFYSGTQPVDSVLYFLQEYPSYMLTGFPENIVPKRLMKKVNSDPADVFSEYINGISFRAINPTTVAVAMDVMTSRADEDYAANSGFRTLAAYENVNMRNAAL